jgi:hypothetical protein
VRPHLPACNTSRNAARVRCKRRSSVDRRLPCEQRTLPMRLTSGKLLPSPTPSPRPQQESRRERTAVGGCCPPRWGHTGCGVRGTCACRGLPSTRGCDAGRAVRCELFCGRAIPPRDSVVQPF